jgi:hypothetical protein
VKENLDLPKEFFEQPSGEQLSEQQERAMRAQMKELLSQNGLDTMERSYVYDDEGRVSRVTIQMGNPAHRDQHLLQRPWGCGRDSSKPERITACTTE